jgi:outer membrane protein TolC
MPERRITNDVARTALDEAMSQRPELAAIGRRREAAEQDLRRARAQRSLTVDLFANYGYEQDRYDADADPLDGWQAGVTARIPIWEGGRIKGDVAQAKSRLEQAGLREQSARLTAELEVRNAWNKAHEAEEILAAAALVIKQAEEALRLAENRYSVGAITQLDVLSSQLEFTQAKLNRITAVHDLYVAMVELEQAIGRVPGRQFLEP